MKMQQAMTHDLKIMVTVVPAISGSQVFRAGELTMILYLAQLLENNSSPFFFGCFFGLFTQERWTVSRLRRNGNVALIHLPFAFGMKGRKNDVRNVQHL